MRWSSAVSTAVPLEAAVREVTATVARELDGARPDLAVVFVSEQHQGEYERAIAELSKFGQEDPFGLSLQAQAYERRNDQAKARELYAAILKMPGHSLQLALSRPLAQRRLAAK